MKKALVILMALAMVFGAFADDLAAVTIKGDASLGYEIDLDNSAYGMTNGTGPAQEYTIQLVTKDIAKSTEGSGIWGELVVKSTDAKIDQTGLTSSAAATLATAKIHFGDILAINVLAPSLDVGNYSAAFVTGDFAAATTAGAANAAFTNGFTAEIALDGIANINVAVADNGVKAKAAKELGVKADVDVKAIDGVTLKAAVAYNGDLNDGIALGAQAGYTLDKLTIAGGFNRGYDEKNTIAAGVLYQWGGADIEPGFDYIADKTKDGVSVAFKTADFSAIGLGVAVADTTFVEGLKFGAELIVGDVLNFGATGDFAAAAAKYATAFGDINFSAHAGFKFDLAASKFGLKYGASVSNATLIQNTTLSVGYEGQHDAAIAGADKKGKITASAKIAF